MKNDEKTSLQNKIKQLQNELAIIKGILKKKEELISSYKMESSLPNKTSSIGTKDLIELTKEYSDKVNSLQEQINYERAKKEELLLEKEIETRKMSELKIELEAKNNELLNSSNEKKNLKDKIDILYSEKCNLENKNKEYINDLTKEKENNNQKQREIIEEYEIKIDNNNKKNDKKINELIEKMTKEKEKSFENLEKKTNDKYEKKINDIKSELEEKYKLEIIDLQAKLTDSEDKEKMYERIIEEKEEKISDLKSNIIETNKKIKEMSEENFKIKKTLSILQNELNKEKEINKETEKKYKNSIVNSQNFQLSSEKNLIDFISSLLIKINPIQKIIPFSDILANIASDIDKIYEIHNKLEEHNSLDFNSNNLLIDFFNDIKYYYMINNYNATYNDYLIGSSLLLNNGNKKYDNNQSENISKIIVNSNLGKIKDIIIDVYNKQMEKSFNLCKAYYEHIIGYIKIKEENKIKINEILDNFIIDDSKSREDDEENDGQLLIIKYENIRINSNDCIDINNNLVMINDIINIYNINNNMKEKNKDLVTLTTDSNSNRNSNSNDDCINIKYIEGSDETNNNNISNNSINNRNSNSNNRNSNNRNSNSNNRNRNSNSNNNNYRNSLTATIANSISNTAANIKSKFTIKKSKSFDTDIFSEYDIERQVENEDLMELIKTGKIKKDSDKKSNYFIYPKNKFNIKERLYFYNLSCLLPNQYNVRIELSSEMSQEEIINILNSVMIYGKKISSLYINYTKIDKYFYNDNNNYDIISEYLSIILNQLNKITKLKIENVLIKSDSMQKMVIPLKKSLINSLTIINSVNKYSVPFLINYLINNKNLITLNLSNNYSPISSILLPALNTSSYIKKLNLSCIILDDGELIYLSDFIRNNRKIEYLDISNNIFSLKMCQTFGKVLCNFNNNLRFLNLDNCGLTTVDKIKSLFNKNNLILKKLSVKNNHFGNDGLVAFIEFCKSNPNLKEIYFNNCGFDGIGIAQFIKSVVIESLAFDLIIDFENNEIKNDFSDMMMEFEQLILAKHYRMIFSEDCIKGNNIVGRLRKVKFVQLV